MTVVGARPQFIKAAAVSRVIADHHAVDIDEYIVHTGQHFDANMSQVFFDDMGIPTPRFSLNISGGGHGAMTGRMLLGLEELMIGEAPDGVLIYGDTNSTLAGALAASKLHIPVLHVEAGLRSFNMQMPEEVNRVLADRVSTLLFCPTQTAVANLSSEGIIKGVTNTGDVMFDSALFYGNLAESNSDIKEELGLESGKFILVTCHRAENTDDPKRLREIVKAIAELSSDMTVVFPLHPRTKKVIKRLGLERYLASVSVTEPLSFIDMIALERSARVILTDSGGVQKEAFFYGVPCLTMRDETEWVETIDLGANVLVGACSERILDGLSRTPIKAKDISKSTPYGDGHAANKIVAEIVNYF